MNSNESILKGSLILKLIFFFGKNRLKSFRMSAEDPLDPKSSEPKLSPVIRCFNSLIGSR